MFNLTTYPHLVGLFDTLGIDTEESEMSFALSMDQGALEWASHGLGTIFAQRENLWKLSFWQMIWDVVRFGREAPKVAPFPHCKNHSGMLETLPLVYCCRTICQVYAKPVHVHSSQQT